MDWKQGKLTREYTAAEMNAGFAAVQELSDKARAFYDYMATGDGMTVYGYDTDDGKRYAFRSRGFHVYDITLQDLENIFDKLFDIEIEEIEREGGLS